METSNQFFNRHKKHDNLKWLIFGDVHGNLPALEKLMVNEKNNYDGIICHGDLINYGPWSNECVQLLNNVKDVILLKGNHEEYFLDGHYPGKHPIARAFFNQCYPKFEQFESIKDLINQFKINAYTIKHTIGNKYIFLDTEVAISDMNGNYIIGHSHQQYQRLVGPYNLVNTGSLGQNRTYINLAEYLLLNDKNNTVQFKKFTYDIDLVINKMESIGYSEICLNYYKNKKRV